MMANSLRSGREALAKREGWRFGDLKRLLYPIIDQQSIWIVARTLPSDYRVSDGEKETIKRRVIAAAIRLGLKVPATWRGLAVAMSSEEGGNMSENKAAVMLRQLADMCEREVSFADDEEAETEAARRRAEDFCQRVNAGLLMAAAPVDESEIPPSTLDFIGRQNARLRRQKEQAARP